MRKDSDYCYDDKILYEYVRCRTNGIRHCPSGYSCWDGACREGTPPSSSSSIPSFCDPTFCQQTDKYLDIFNKGTDTYFDATCRLVSRSDYCYDDKILYEYVHCGAMGRNVCPDGYSCWDGACRAGTPPSSSSSSIPSTCDETFCHQTDAYDDIYHKGTDTYYDYQTGTCTKTVSDYCYDDHILMEYVHCNSGGRRDCPAGYGCWDGACREGTPPSSSSSSIPSSFDYNFCLQTDVLDDIYHKGMDIYCSQQNQSRCIPVTDTDYCINQSTLWEVVRCRNKGQRTCPSGFSCWDGACQEGTPPSSGSSSSSSSSASFSSDPFSCNFDFCRQTDGGDDIYQKGTDTYNKLGDNGCVEISRTDYCSDNKTLNEYVCRNSSPRTCSAGYSCWDGACRTGTPPSSSSSSVSSSCDFTFCQQTDGGDDIYHKGTDSYYDLRNGVCELLSRTDYCYDDNILNEYQCRSDGQRSCPNGCQDGACKE